MTIRVLDLFSVNNFGLESLFLLEIGGDSSERWLIYFDKRYGFFAIPLFALNGGTRMTSCFRLEIVSCWYFRGYRMEVKGLRSYDSLLVNFWFSLFFGLCGRDEVPECEGIRSEIRQNGCCEGRYLLNSPRIARSSKTDLLYKLWADSFDMVLAASSRI